MTTTIDIDEVPGVVGPKGLPYLGHALDIDALLAFGNVEADSYVVAEHPDESVESLTIDPDWPDRSTVFDGRLATRIRAVWKTRKRYAWSSTSWPRYRPRTRPARRGPRCRDDHR
jgi:hypothetical protein